MSFNILEDWKEKKIGDCIELIYGKGLPERRRKKGNIPVFGSNGIVGFHDEAIVKAPGIIIGRKGSVGEVAFSKQDFWSIDTTYYVQTKKGNDILFWYYFLMTLGLKQMNTHSAVPGLNRDGVIEIVRAIPNLIEQHAIASVLGSFDDKIELNRQMNATLEKIGQAIFKHWFVDFEFPNKEGKSYKSSGGEMVDSELGEIPKGWKTQSIYSCARYINGDAFRNTDFSFDRTGLPIVKIAELKYGITSQTEFTKKDIDPKYKITNGDILFAWSGSPDTSIDTFIWTGGDAWLNQHIFKVIPHSPFEKEFIYFLLRYFKKIFIEIARNKQTTGLGHVTAQDMKIIPFIIPPDEIIKQFENVTSSLFNYKLNNSIESHTANAMRDILLSKLMSGEIRVNVPEKEEGAIA